MMEYFGNIFGNENIISFFSTAKEKGNLAHAYIIEGDFGSGKKLLARSVCSLIANADVERTNKIHLTICPDVMEYGLPEKKKFIPIETVRTIKSEAYIKPSELDIKAFIIDDAHMLTQAGQNALLKLLEEPPADVYFFLLCQNASALLPTVRSRAPTVRMQRFSEDQLEAYLEEKHDTIQNTDKKQLKSLCKKAGGSIGVLLELIENSSKAKKGENGEGCGKTEEIIRSLKEKNFSSLLCAVQALPQDRKLLDAALSDLAVKVRDMVASSGGSDLFMSSDEQACKEIRGNLTVKNLILIYQCIDEAQTQLNMNMNVQIVKTSLAKHIMRAAR